MCQARKREKKVSFVDLMQQLSNFVSSQRHFQFPPFLLGFFYQRYLEPICCKKQQKKFLTSYCTVMIHYLKNKVGVVDFANAQGVVMF